MDGIAAFFTQIFVMKKAFITLLLFITNITICIAQNNTEKEIIQKSQEFNDSLSIYLNNKDYSGAEHLLYDYIDWFYSNSPEIQQKYSFIVPQLYYNIACYQSLQNKQASAVQSLEKAYQSGWNNYRHLITDTDLDNIRSDSKFQEISAKMKEESDYIYILQKAPEYTTNNQTDTLPDFSYATQNDSNLVRVRQHFNLDSIAGTGDEISKIKNLLSYVHDNIKHDGSNGNPQPFNSINLYEACKTGSRGLNCRGLAMVLNEMYLAMGIKSRFVTCFPQKYISDCHVINAVYSETLDKWLWVDPTWDALVYDENDVPLSIQEVRERIIDGRPLRLHDDANWNNREQATVDGYLYDYMAKNLYYIQACNRYEFNTESNGISHSYIMLCPTGLSPKYETSTNVMVNDDTYFWQTPRSK